MDTTEENGLMTRSEQSFELAPTASAAMVQYEIQSAIVIARRFPRNEDQAFAKLMKRARQPTFADDATYSYPRGKKKDAETGEWVENIIEGPSVYLAREGARVWGNVRYGLEVIRDDEESRQIRGWTWDLETNVRISAEDQFGKLIQKRQYDNGRYTGTSWVTADERELRELQNRRGAILIRNVILQLLPSDLISDVLAECDRTLKSKAKEDPEATRLASLVVHLKSPYVFVHQHSGKRWTNPDKKFRAGRKKAGLEWVTFHTLRHFRGTRWIAGGVDVKTVKDALGHSDIRTTMRYAHHVESHADEALRRVQQQEAIEAQNQCDRAKTGRQGTGGQKE